MHAVLVANRGEIARRVFRTCREMGIATVAVFSDPDADAPFVREADAAVRLPGSTPAETYLRGDLVIAAAQQAGADAIHPGYGFLSEDAAFARAVIAAGLTWIGPPPGAVESMGSKLAAKELMAAAGVPCLPGGEVDPVTAGSVAERIGYPVLVKAAYGGGGRGMRIVRTEAELAEAVHGARREAESAFGDGTVFLERYVERPRHVEVQVMADTHGTVVALFERDCSLQRRHQKVVEEAPSPVVDAALRTRLSEASVAAARAVGYVGAGTVEFVVDEKGEPAFLEMNTRLQVEHPVTELVTGLDLVRLQILVAQGLPLPDEALQPILTGHAVEARLYAEDVPAGYLPATGTIHRFDVPEGVRVDSGVETGSVVSPFYDAMLAKVVAHGATRAEACARLAGALERTKVHGVTTNRDLLVRVLRSAEFLGGEVDTGYLDRVDPAVIGGARADASTERLHAVAAALAGSARRAAAASPRLPSGWRSVPSALQQTSYDGVRVGYAFRRGGVVVEVDGERLELTLVELSPELVVVEADGVRRRIEVHQVGDTAYVDSALGSSVLVEQPRFPDPGSGLAAGSLTAPMPGTVVRVAAEKGQPVAAGDVLVVLEAMKMEHAVRASVDGTVEEVLVAAGEQVQDGAVLVVVT
ncbi:MAG: methylcrotonoyl-CoA carboxylase [Frankiales bacterium]|nr:methylcrotonoyl-CoA carboxylase [Frankiales bacterium]